MQKTASERFPGAMTVNVRSAWQKTPHVKLPLRGAWASTWGQIMRHCTAIPGFRVDKRGSWVHVPYHAIPALEPYLRSVGNHAVEAIRHATWTRPYVANIDWEVARTHLLSQHVRAGILDGLYAWQKVALCRYLLRDGLLQHPTGSGKTRTFVLWLLGSTAPGVIITKDATCTQIAQKASALGFPAYHLKAKSRRRKRDMWADGASYVAWCRSELVTPILVVGWSGLTSLLPEIVALGVGSVVFDESQFGKSWGRWKRIPLPVDPKVRALRVLDLEALGGFARHDVNTGVHFGLVPALNRSNAALALARLADRRLACTATPVEDRIRDLYGQLTLVTPDTWGSWSLWSRRYAGARDGQWGGIDTRGATRQGELAARVDALMHVVDARIVRAELPGLIRESLYITPEDQAPPPQDFAQQVRAAKRRGGSSELECRLAMSAHRKIPFVLDHLDDALGPKRITGGLKITIITARREDCETLYRQACKRFKNRARILMAYGKTSPAKRYAIAQDYVSEEQNCILIGTGQSWGTGVDGLQCTDLAYFVMLPYSPGKLEQWEGRFPRIGQTSPITVYYVICERTVDEHVVSILLDKLPSVDRIGSTYALAGAEEAIGGMSDEDAIIAAIVERMNTDR